MFAQIGVGAIQQPEASEGVLYEVTDNPMRGEELGDGRNIFRRYGAFARHDRVFLFGDVELVEPTEDLDFRAVVVGDFGAEAVDDGVLS